MKIVTEYREQNPQLIYLSLSVLLSIGIKEGERGLSRRNLIVA